MLTSFLLSKRPLALNSFTEHGNDDDLKHGTVRYVGYKTFTPSGKL